MLVAYNLLYCVILACAAALLASTVRSAPFCPKATAPWPNTCSRYYTFIIFASTWTFIMTLSSALHWWSLGKTMSEKAEGFRVTHFFYRTMLTLGLWLVGIILAGIIRFDKGCIFGPIVLISYLYLFAVEWQPERGQIVDALVAKLSRQGMQWSRRWVRAVRNQEPDQIEDHGAPVQPAATNARPETTMQTMRVGSTGFLNPLSND